METTKKNISTSVKRSNIVTADVVERWTEYKIKVIQQKFLEFKMIETGTKNKTVSLNIWGLEQREE